MRENPALQDMQEDLHSLVQWLSPLSTRLWIVLQKDTFYIYIIFIFLLSVSC